MVKVIVKKRKTLLLPKSNTETNEGVTKENKHEMLNKCRSWLKDSWPLLFDPNAVKPLKVGILKDIQAEYDRVGGGDVLGFGRSFHITKVLYSWTKHRKYLKALSCKDAVRYDLVGCIVGKVSPEDAERAKAMLSRSQNKRKGKQRVLEVSA